MSLSTSSTLRIAAGTLNQTPIDWKNNISNIIQAIGEARKIGATLLLLPELCICGYGCEDLFLADWLVEKSLEKLKELVPETKGIAVSVGLPVKHQGILYNCACLLSDGEILGFSAKQHLANDGVHYEHRWFEPWKKQGNFQLEIEGKTYPFGDVVYDLNGIKIACEICEDMWHEEDRPAALHQQRGVKVILNPSASPFTFGKTKRREKIIVNSTLKYNCTYVYANLLGNESGRIVFDGELFIASNGEVLSQNKRFSYENVNLISHDFSLENNRLVSISEKTIPKEEIKETEFYKAASLGLFDYQRKSKSKCYVLSLSGGADSTCCAALVYLMVKSGVEELGTEKFLAKMGLVHLYSAEATHKSLFPQFLHCAYQSTQNSSKDTFTSAKEVAEQLGARFYDWKIDEAVKEYTETVEQALHTHLTWETHDLALQNIQARVRAPFIWLLANLKNGLLITTSNRSEGDVGYCTMDGDTAGGIAPIAGVEKIFVQHWLKWAEKEFGWTSFHHVNNLKPSAELRPLETKQTDEADLMPYSLLAQIEDLAIQKRKSPQQVLDWLDDGKEYSRQELKKYLSKFYKLWQQNQWKRERLAPGFHLDEFNVDPKTWCRFPILGGGFEEELANLK